MKKHTLTAKNRDSGLAWGFAGAALDDLSRSIDDALQSAIGFLDLRRKCKILDLGCGTGRVARSIVSANPRIQVQGVDISRDLIRAAKGFSKVYGLPAQFSVGEAERLQFKRGEFDQVISTFGVIFAADPDAASLELARVCRPGGKLVITAWKPSPAMLGVEDAFAGQKSRPAGTPLAPQYEWGRRGFVNERLGSNFRLEFHSGVSQLLAPNAEWIWDLWARTTLCLSLALKTKVQREHTKRMTIQYLNRFKMGSGICLPREYLIITGIRRGST